MKKCIYCLLLYICIVFIVGCGDAASNDKTYSSENSNTIIETSRRIYYTVEISVETEDLNKTINDITNETNRLNGYISNSYISDNGNSSIIVRVPTKDLFVFLEKIENSDDKITDKKISSFDITSNYNKIEARLQVLNSSKEAYLKLLAEAKSINDIIIIQNKLEELDSEILELEMQKANYDNLIDYSTITIYLNYEESNYFKQYFNYLGKLCVIIFTVFIYTMPFGIIALLIVFIIKYISKINKNGKEKNEKKNKNF